MSNYSFKLHVLLLKSPLETDLLLFKASIHHHVLLYFFSTFRHHGKMCLVMHEQITYVYPSHPVHHSCFQ